MSRADEIYIQTCRDILENGVWDTDRAVRPHWEDGAPAHTVKKFCVVNRYDLREEFPIMTLRRTYYRSCIQELLWIWQKKSNRISELGSHIWDSWAREDGTIGKAYGYQLGVKHVYPEGMFDQVDRVLYALRHDPAFAQVSGLQVGELVHVIADCHIYDRHVPLVEKMLENPSYPAPKFVMDKAVTDFYDFTVDSFQMEDYRFAPFDEKIPVAI